MKSWEDEPSEREGREPRLDDRVRDLLEANGGRLAFNGLKRALGAHPESLSRALRRLERDGVVRRRDDGYVLAEPESTSAEPRVTPVTHTVASLQLPAGSAAEAVLGQLAGRWFGSLRWVGVYDRPGDPWLVWSLGSSPDHVILSVRSGSLRVLIEGPPGGPVRPDLESASWDLLRHALDRLRPAPPPEDPSLATFHQGENADPGWAGFAA